jgi:hypothetical protein
VGDQAIAVDLFVSRRPTRRMKESVGGSDRHSELSVACSECSRSLGIRTTVAEEA